MSVKWARTERGSLPPGPAGLLTEPSLASCGKRFCPRPLHLCGPPHDGPAGEAVCSAVRLLRRTARSVRPGLGLASLANVPGAVLGTKQALGPHLWDVPPGSVGRHLFPLALCSRGRRSYQIAAGWRQGLGNTGAFWAEGRPSPEGRPEPGSGPARCPRSQLLFRSVLLPLSAFPLMAGIKVSRALKLQS